MSQEECTKRQIFILLRGPWTRPPMPIPDVRLRSFGLDPTKTHPTPLDSDSGPRTGAYVRGRRLWGPATQSQGQARVDSTDLWPTSVSLAKATGPKPS